MGVRILCDRDSCRAALYDSVTETAFGPLLIGDDAESEAECFLAWLQVDARILSADLLSLAHCHWHRTHHDANGEWLEGRNLPDDESRRVQGLCLEAEHEHEHRRRLRRFAARD